MIIKPIPMGAHHTPDSIRRVQLEVTQLFQWMKDTPHSLWVYCSDRSLGGAVTQLYYKVVQEIAARIKDAFLLEGYVTADYRRDQIVVVASDLVNPSMSYAWNINSTELTPLDTTKEPR